MNPISPKKQGKKKGPPMLCAEGHVGSEND